MLYLQLQTLFAEQVREKKWGNIMGFTISVENLPAITQVPNWFIRTYMPTANGNFVKIYLYLLMLCQHPVHISEQSVRYLADCMECTESDILRALRFWKREHLLEYTEENGEIISIALTQLPNTSEKNEPDVILAGSSEVKEELSATISPADTQKSQQEMVLPDKQTYTPLQAEALMKDVEIEQTITSVEQLLGSTVSMTHLQLILYFMCDLGFSRELILAMYETALKKGKNSPKYIEAIGISWAKQGIKTVAEAKEEVSAFSGRYSLVAKALGIQRSLVPAERNIIDGWEAYHFADTIIEEACKRTVLQTGGTNLQYVSSILENWAKHHVISLSDVSKCDEAYKRQKKAKREKHSPNTTRSKNQFQNFPQRSYSNEDYSSLEKRLLRSTHSDTTERV